MIGLLVALCSSLIVFGIATVVLIKWYNEIETISYTPNRCRICHTDMLKKIDDCPKCITK